MNKLWKTCKHARTLIEMAFLCTRPDLIEVPAENTVKQRGHGGTLLHKAWGITGFSSAQTPNSDRIFCERNENRIIIACSFRPGSEQSPGYSVF
jgi:hypothetical protein